MLPQIIFIVFLVYSSFLFLISYFTARKSTNKGYFIGNRQSPWPVVAYGMVGASLSGVTFISVPGWVGASHFTYMMVVFGYIVGYIIITKFLLPLYYRLNLISIYSYLEQRFGYFSYKTGAFYFLLSRTIGASFRMFLVINVLQIFIFNHWGVPFWLTVILFILLITLYTFKGGIKTIVWTDLLQTTFMLASLIVTIYIILDHLDVSFSDLFIRAKEAGYTEMINTDWRNDRFYLKQFFSGMFITIVMTGLDQDMMQKNLSCRTVKDAQKNMMTLGLLLVPVNLLFLFLGASLYIYATDFGISLPNLSDDLFPMLAINYFGPAVAIIFFIGLIAAAYSSADGAITALTTSFTIDILGVNSDKNRSENELKKVRYKTHFFISSLIIIVIVLFREINDQAVIARLFTIAGYTYGPLLGLFAFGIFTKKALNDRWVPLVAILAPIISYLLSFFSEYLFNGYQFGFEILIVNGLLTFAGLFIIQKNKND
ncbi:MAG: sodium:solute symporter [Bacteroidetes bacterium HGW-Bacteroidetes-1]|nr:MAG: sodium:solute symporter [Bacteroidetes bacterium HGW-Bacteroidetes-1]